MRRGAVLLGIPLILGTALAQTQPSSNNDSRISDESSEHIYSPKEGVKPPKVREWHDPEYPKGRRNSDTNGDVVLSVVVGRTGVPRDVTVVRSLRPDLDEIAVDAVKKWKFVPATRGGKPVASRIILEIPFRFN